MSGGNQLCLKSQHKYLRGLMGRKNSISGLNTQIPYKLDSLKMILLHSQFHVEQYELEQQSVGRKIGQILYTWNAVSTKMAILGCSSWRWKPCSSQYITLPYFGKSAKKLFYRKKIGLQVSKSGVFSEKKNLPQNPWNFGHN